MQKLSKTILFIPEVGIFPFIRSLAIVGDALKKQGDTVYLTYCTGQMIRCPMMDMFRLSAQFLPSEKKRLCHLCSKQFAKVIKEYDFEIINLSDFIDQDLLQSIEGLTLSPANTWENTVYQGFSVGKMAQFDFALATKCAIYPNMSLEHQTFFGDYIKNTSLALALADKIIKVHAPHLLFAYNPYGQCQGVRYASEQLNIPFFQVENASLFGADFSQFLFLKKTYAKLIHSQNWKNSSEQPINSHYVMECWKDTVFRFYSQFSHVFSSRKNGNIQDLFNQLALDLKKKTIVVYTSSQDERVGFNCVMEIWKECKPPIEVFKSQIEWLLMLKAYSTRNKDIQIIVRIHPREGNRQFGFLSRHLIELKEAIGQSTPSFIIIWPDDPISSYDLLELADLCLVSWSYMGQEATRVGIPTLSYLNGMYYSNDDFMQTANNLKEYEEKIEQMLGMNIEWKHLLKAVRFFHWRTFVPSLDLGKDIPSDCKNNQQWPHLSDSSAKIVNRLLKKGPNVIEYNINNWMKSLTNNSEKEETKALRLGIRLFLDKLFYPPKPTKPNSFFNRVVNYFWKKISTKELFYLKENPRPFSDYQLIYSEDLSCMNSFIKQTHDNHALRVILSDSKNVQLIHNGKTIERISPMAARLARLHHQNTTSK